MENVPARIYCEAGGGVTTNVMVRDMDLARPDVHDARRLEVVVDGLSIFGECPVSHGHHGGQCTPRERRSTAQGRSAHTRN